MSGPNVCRRAAECLICLALALPSAAQSDNSAIGDVLQLRGTWRIAGKTSPLLEGTGLPAGALVQAVGGQKNDFIVLVLLDGRRLVATCSSSPCDASVRLPDVNRSGDVGFKHMLDAVMLVLLDRRPEVANAYSSTSSRGFDANRGELVVPFAPGKEIQLSQALGDLAGGDYHLEITRVSDGSFVLSKEAHFDNKHGATVVLPSAGPYLVTISDSVSNPVTDLLLIAAPEGSESSTEKALLEARRICAKWDGPQAEGSAHLFVRSYLLAVAKKP